MHIYIYICIYALTDAHYLCLACTALAIASKQRPPATACKCSSMELHAKGCRVFCVLLFAVYLFTCEFSNSAFMASSA